MSEFREGQIRKEVSQGIVDGVLKLIGMLMLLWIGTIVLLVFFASITTHWWVVIPMVVGAAMIVVSSRMGMTASCRRNGQLATESRSAIATSICHESMPCSRGSWCYPRTMRRILAGLTSLALALLASSARPAASTTACS